MMNEDTGNHQIVPPPPASKEDFRSFAWKVAIGVCTGLLIAGAVGALTLNSSVEGLEQAQDTHLEYGHRETTQSLTKINERLTRIETTLQAMQQEQRRRDRGRDE